jgi:hypothetical protein
VANPSRHEGDHYYLGSVTFRDVTLPASSVEATHIEASAGVEQTKLEHQHRAQFNQPNTAATSETRAVAVIYGAEGTLLTFEAGSIAKAVGDSTVTVDLKKNGASVLSAVITLDNANTNRVAEAVVPTTTALADGDLLEIVTVATIGTGTLPTGVFAEVRWAEDAS